jgi:cation transport regulator ChaB
MLQSICKNIYPCNVIDISTTINVVPEHLSTLYASVIASAMTSYTNVDMAMADYKYGVVAKTMAVFSVRVKHKLYL